MSNDNISFEQRISDLETKRRWVTFSLGAVAFTSAVLAIKEINDAPILLTAGRAFVAAVMPIAVYKQFGFIAQDIEEVVEEQRLDAIGEVVDMIGAPPSKKDSPAPI